MYLQQQDNRHGWAVVHLLCPKVFLTLQGALWATLDGGGDGGGEWALEVGEILQIFSYLNIHSKDFHILHNEGRQQVDILLLFLKKFVFGSMVNFGPENDSGFIINGP